MMELVEKYFESKSAKLVSIDLNKIFLTDDLATNLKMLNEVWFSDKIEKYNKNITTTDTSFIKYQKAGETRWS